MAFFEEEAEEVKAEEAEATEEKAEEAKAEEAPAKEAKTEETKEEEKSQNAAADAFAKFTNTKNTTADYDVKDIEDNKVFGILAYIWILFLVPMLAAPESKFSRFHANQGLVLFICEVIVGAVCAVLSLIPFVGAILGSLCGLVMLLFMIIGIINAAQGEAKELPLIGGIKILK